MKIIALIFFISLPALYFSLWLLLRKIFFWQLLFKTYGASFLVIIFIVAGLGLLLIDKLLILSSIYIILALACDFHLLITLGERLLRASASIRERIYKFRIRYALETYFFHALILVLSFAGIYRNFNIKLPRSYVFTAGTQPVTDFIDFIYFSVITATTLGFGDIIPSNGIARMISVIEAIAGIPIIIVSISLIFSNRD